MTEGRNADAMIAARRCLEAVTDATDYETRLALWKAAKRYAERAREGAGIDTWYRPPLAPRGLDLGLVRARRELL